MRAPPLLPEETLFRVMRFARFNGLSVLVVAGVFGLICAASKEVPGAAIGVLVAGAGALELHGVGLLHHGDKRGVSWLIGSQLYLLVIVLAYVSYRSQHLDLESVRMVLSSEQRETIAAAGLEETEFLRIIAYISNAIFGVITFLYQGGIALYYHRRRAPIEAALELDQTDEADPT